MATQDSYVFKPFQLDFAPLRLWRMRAGKLKQLHLTPTQLEVLRCLVQKYPDVVSLDEFKKHVWGKDDINVSGEGLRGYIRDLRVELGDSAKRPRYIKTARRGYSFLKEDESKLGSEETQEEPPLEPEDTGPLPIPTAPESLNVAINDADLLSVEIDGRFHSMAELPELELPHRRLVLFGGAGAGKTVASWRILKSRIGKMPTVFIGQEGWIRALGDDFLDIGRGKAIRDYWRSALDELLRWATTAVTIRRLEQSARQKGVLLVIDSINGGSASVAMQVLEVLNEALRQWELAIAVVTDRNDSRYTGTGLWTVARMTTNQRVAQGRIDKEFGSGRWAKLPVGSQRLLLSPFFLDLAMRGDDLESSTRSEALTKFVAKAVEARIVEKAVVATAVAYASGSRELPLDALEPDDRRALTDAGIAFEVSSHQPHLAFAHELFGDYFASLFVKERSDTWHPRGFDNISFSRDRAEFEGLSSDNRSFDAITLAAEQMPSDKRKNRGDSYLRAVYDWNWRAAVDCLAVTDPLNGPFSPTARLVVLALLSERRSDPIDGTRQRADRLLRALPDEPAKQLVKAKEGEARRVISSFNFEDQWFARWREVFCRDSNEAWSEDAVDSICDDDTLHGWTVSFALKRSTISSEICQRLQGIYQGLKIGTVQLTLEEPTCQPQCQESKRQASMRQASIRWRLVRSMATGKGPFVLSFLISALDEDPYPWVRWEAARAITEFAARSEERELTARAIAALRARTLPASVAKEIAWVARYHGAAPHFHELVGPLLQALRSQASAGPARDWWDENIRQIDRFFSCTPANGCEG